MKKIAITQYIALLLLCYIQMASAQTTFIPNAVTDIDGNTYNALKIGEQVWMAENMRAIHDRNGQEFLFGNDGKKDTSIYKPYCYYPDHDSNNIFVHGYLYNWPAADKVCPLGWHLPAEYEWTQLLDFIGQRSNYTGVEREKKIAAVLSSEFRAFPSGSSYGSFGDESYFWTAITHDYREAYARGIYFNYGVLPHRKYVKASGFSVRCIRDKEATTQSIFIPNAVTDIDGNIYNAVQIGDQVWMAENMKAIHDRDKKEIALEKHRASLNTPYRYYPGYDQQNVSQYGYLYNWKAALKICPSGWHLPTDEEWTQLTDFISSHEQYICDGDKTMIAKALSSQDGWTSSKDNSNHVVGNEPEKNNATGFSALPAGMFGVFEGMIEGYSLFFRGCAYFWSASEDIHHYNGAYYRELAGNLASVTRNTFAKIDGLSVRCIRDKEDKE